jgi:hypothetical protein
MIFKHHRAVPLSRRLVNALSEETRDRSWANPCEIRGGQSDSGTGFLRVICRLCRNGKRAHPGNGQIKFYAGNREHAITLSMRQEVICVYVCTVCFIGKPPLSNLEVVKNTENLLLRSKEKWEKYPVPASNMSRSLHALSSVREEYVLNLIGSTETTSCLLYRSLCDVTTRFTNEL